MPQVLSFPETIRCGQDDNNACGYLHISLTPYGVREAHILLYCLVQPSRDRSPTLLCSFPILAPLAVFSPSLTLSHFLPLSPLRLRSTFFPPLIPPLRWGLICRLLCLQNAKSYDDLKAELGNSGDWSQIADVSLGVRPGGGHIHGSWECWETISVSCTPPPPPPSLCESPFLVFV